VDANCFVEAYKQSSGSGFNAQILWRNSHLGRRPVEVKDSLSQSFQQGRLKFENMGTLEVRGGVI
jgi:hypothetical protein